MSRRDSNRGSRERDRDRDRGRDRPSEKDRERDRDRDRGERDRDRDSQKRRRSRSREKDQGSQEKEKSKKPRESKFSVLPPGGFFGDPNIDIFFSPSLTGGSNQSLPSQSAERPAEPPPRPNSEQAAERRVVLRGKSRFSDLETPIPIPTSIGDLQKEAMRIQLELQTVTAKLCSPFIPLPPVEERSPSPEPQYDGKGQRSNNRDQRTRQKLAIRRAQLIAEAMKLPPQFRPAGMDGGGGGGSAGGVSSRGSLRFDKKVFIPWRDYPDINFVGLIIGPRGNTQKRMERETGCKISIRGKGGQKEKAKRGPQPGDDEDLHVFIQGDTPDRVDQTAKLIEKLLSNSDEANIHKARQLQELASINGAVPDLLICRVCGGTGHKVYACPERSGSVWRPADIMCEKCGSGMHLTIDCPMLMDENGKPKNADYEEKVTKEYTEFIEEMVGEKLPAGYFARREDVRKVPDLFDDSSGYLFPLVDTGHIYAPGTGTAVAPLAAPKPPPVPPPPPPKGKKQRRRKPKPGAAAPEGAAVAPDAAVASDAASANDVSEPAAEASQNGSSDGHPSVAPSDGS